MSYEKLLDEVISVTATLDGAGMLTPKHFERRGRRYGLLSVGRQWESESGRHVLVEASDGARYELLLGRADLLWRLKRVWLNEMVA